MTMSLWFNIVIIVFMLNITVVVLTEHRRSTETLAWLLVLYFLPVLGILLYYFFGVPAMHRPLISAERLDELKAHTAPYRANEVDTQQHHLIALLEGVNHAYPVGGNSLKVFTVCGDMFEAMKLDIRAAHHHVHMEFFMIEDDMVGGEFAEILIGKAREGVEVRLMYDAAACIGVPRKFFRRMKEGGVKVEAFSPLFPHLSPFTNYRNHRKVLVVDGVVGYAGGMNLAERYLKGIRGGVWRDTHVRIEGPAVTELQTTFLTDWQFASGEWVHDVSYYPQQDQAGKLLMQVVTSNPTAQFRVIDLSYSEILHTATRYVYLQSPYLVPSEAIRKALYAAAFSGVDVRVMIPTNPDKGWVVIYASRWYIDQMLDAGVRVFFYDNGYLHAKTVVSDDRLFTVGSVNIDHRSISQSFEVTAFIYDAEVATRQRQTFLDDQQYCHEIKREEWRRRSRWERMKESVCRLAAPIL
ncbi:MAG: cardiolipin synthase [Bacteroidales bacterium]|nr:cardiolipin synthase [Bacteroidales bacterium]